MIQRYQIASYSPRTCECIASFCFFQASLQFPKIKYVRGGRIAKAYPAFENGEQLADAKQPGHRNAAKLRQAK